MNHTFVPLEPVIHFKIIILSSHLNFSDIENSLWTGLITNTQRDKQLRMTLVEI
jgi:hypothetical protein